MPDERITTEEARDQIKSAIDAILENAYDEAEKIVNGKLRESLGSILYPSGKIGFYNDNNCDEDLLVVSVTGLIKGFINCFEADDVRRLLKRIDLWKKRCEKALREEGELP